ncbi:MAG: hypothetical protein ACK52J_02565 [bacterium]
MFEKEMKVMNGEVDEDWSHNDEDGWDDFMESIEDDIEEDEDEDINGTF